MGGDGLGGQFPLETWFWEMPGKSLYRWSLERCLTLVVVCTRVWTTATVLTSALVQCQIVTPFQLFYSFRSVFIKNQVSRSTVRRFQHDN